MWGYPYNLAFDPEGNLFVSHLSTVLVYSNPVSDPKLVRDFCGDDYAFAFDAKNVYISGGYEDPSVHVFPLGVDGCPVVSSQLLGGYPQYASATGVAVRNGVVYSTVIDRGRSANAIFVYRLGPGTREPLQVIPLFGTTNPLWLGIGW